MKVGSLEDGALQALAPRAELKTMPLAQLVQLQKQFRQDLGHIETVRFSKRGGGGGETGRREPCLIDICCLLLQHVSQRLAFLCMACKELPRCVVFQPCQHLVLCEKCVEGLGKEPKCPHCGTRVTQCSTIIIPV